MNEAETNGNGNGNGNRAKFRLPIDADAQERLWADEDFPAAEERAPFNIADSLASLGFIGAAVRRRRRFWALLGIIGMVAGLGVFVKYPVSYAATVSVIVKNNPDQDPVSAMLTQVILVESRTVAADTVKALGLTQSVSSLQAALTASDVTDEVISITVTAPTGADAVDRANQVAAQYLKFRANMLLGQQAQDVASLAAQVPAAQQQIASLQSKIAALKGQGSTSAKLTSLQDQLTTATNTLPTLESNVTGLTASEKSTTSSMIDGTQVLDPATLVHHSKLKDMAEYVVSGLIGGLAIGLGIVVVAALISDRLRRRDDIAAALGAPVRLSVGPLGKSRFSLRPPANGKRDQGRVVAYLRSEALRPSRGPRTLAIITVDNAAEIAPAVAALAEGCSNEGKQLVVTDLVQGAPVAKLLGADGTGVRPVRFGAVNMIVVTPEDDYLVPSGPLRPSDGPAGSPLAAPPAEAVVAAARHADLLLTVAELDPAVGGEHMGTWAGTAVAVFTAGRTRAARAYAVGEMLRLSGIRTISGVVVGADKTDESLGLPPEPAAAAPVGVRPTQTAGPNAGQLR